MQAFDLVNREIFPVKTGKSGPRCGEGEGHSMQRLMGKDIPSEMGCFKLLIEHPPLL